LETLDRIQEHEATLERVAPKLEAIAEAAKARKKKDNEAAKAREQDEGRLATAEGAVSGLQGRLKELSDLKATVAAISEGQSARKNKEFEASKARKGLGERLDAVEGSLGTLGAAAISEGRDRQGLASRLEATEVALARLGNEVKDNAQQIGAMSEGAKRRREAEKAEKAKVLETPPPSPLPPRSPSIEKEDIEFQVTEVVTEVVTPIKEEIKAELQHGVTELRQRLEVAETRLACADVEWKQLQEAFAQEKTAKNAALEQATGRLDKQAGVVREQAATVKKQAAIGEEDRASIEQANVALSNRLKILEAEVTTALRRLEGPPTPRGRSQSASMIAPERLDVLEAGIPDMMGRLEGLIKKVAALEASLEVPEIDKSGVPEFSVLGLELEERMDRLEVPFQPHFSNRSSTFSNNQSIFSNNQSIFSMHRPPRGGHSATPVHKPMQPLVFHRPRLFCPLQTTLFRTKRGVTRACGFSGGVGG